PPNAIIQPNTGLFTWHTESIIAPWTNQITVRVSDNGIPPMSAAATFSVHVLPRPNVTAIEPTANGGCFIEFTTVPGKVYRVDYKDDLKDTDWHILAPESTATGESLVITDPIVQSQRFYRIVVLD